MKYFTLFLFLFVTTAGINEKQINGLADELNGTWIPVKQELNGKLLPASALEKQQLTIADSNYTFIEGGVDKGVLNFKNGKMDIYGKEGPNTGKHFTAIYKLENEQLTICYNLAGDTYPETFDTNGKAMYFLSVFRKVKQ